MNEKKFRKWNVEKFLGYIAVFCGCGMISVFLIYFLLFPPVPRTTPLTKEDYFSTLFFSLVFGFPALGSLLGLLTFIFSRGLVFTDAHLADLDTGVVIQWEDVTDISTSMRRMRTRSGTRIDCETVVSGKNAGAIPLSRWQRRLKSVFFRSGFRSPQEIVVNYDWYNKYFHIVWEIVGRSEHATVDNPTKDIIDRKAFPLY